jgi:hypothetical protein
VLLVGQAPACLVEEMIMSKFEIGTRVVRKDIKYSDYDGPQVQRGVIATESTIDPLHKTERAYVKWDHTPYNKPNPQELSVENLILESEGDKIADKMEAEFQKLNEEVSAKMAEAARLIDEASSLAEDSGRELHMMHEAMSPFLQAMDDAGWRTSSLSC